MNNKHHCSTLSLFSFLLLLLFYCSIIIVCLYGNYGLTDVHLSVIARKGSGSASRSVYGGFVSWEKGEREDGKDSIAVQVRREGRGNPVNCTIIFISLCLSFSLSLFLSLFPSLALSSRLLLILTGLIYRFLY